MNSVNGGPAFPREKDDYEGDSSFGMSLRDYFAAKAMAVIVAGKSEEEGWGLSIENKKYVADEAYALADAMLAVRSKP